MYVQSSEYSYYCWYDCYLLGTYILIAFKAFKNAGFRKIAAIDPDIICLPILSYRTLIKYELLIIWFNLKKLVSTSLTMVTMRALLVCLHILLLIYVVLNMYNDR